MAKPLTTRILALPAPCIRPIAIRPLAALVPKSTIHFSPLSPTSTSSPHRHFSRHAPSSNWALWPRKEPAKWYFGETPRSWTVEEVQEALEKPERGRIIIDVREPAELAATGRIPGARSMPLTSNPDAVLLTPELFYRRFGFSKPGTSVAERRSRREVFTDAVKKARDAGDAERAEKATAGLEDLESNDTEEEVNEVIFYCRSGVRSSDAAHVAGLETMGWTNVMCGDMKGGWLEWEAKGGKVERVEQLENAEQKEK